MQASVGEQVDFIIREAMNQENLALMYAAENKKFSEVQRVIQDIGVGLKDIVTGHHKLMADVALLLRTIQRIENFEFPAITNFSQS